MNNLRLGTRPDTFPSISFSGGIVPRVRLFLTSPTGHGGSGVRGVCVPCVDPCLVKSYECCVNTFDDVTFSTRLHNPLYFFSLVSVYSNEIFSTKIFSFQNPVRYNYCHFLSRTIFSFSLLPLIQGDKRNLNPFLDLSKRECILTQRKETYY